MPRVLQLICPFAKTLAGHISIEVNKSEGDFRRFPFSSVNFTLFLYTYPGMFCGGIGGKRFEGIQNGIKVFKNKYNSPGLGE